MTMTCCSRLTGEAIDALFDDLPATQGGVDPGSCLKEVVAALIEFEKQHLDERRLIMHAAIIDRKIVLVSSRRVARLRKRCLNRA